MEVHFRSCFFQCPYKKCKGTFTKKYNLKVHYENKHSGNVFPRNLKKVTTKAYSAKSGKTYPCPMCNKLFRHRKSNLQRHIQNVHKSVTQVACDNNANEEEGEVVRGETEIELGMDIALQSLHAENQDSATAGQGEGNTIGQPMNIWSEDEMELDMARMALHTHTDTDQNKDSAITEIEEDELDEQPMKQRAARHGKGRVRTRYVCVCKKMFDTKQKITDHVTSQHGGDRYVCSLCFIKSKHPEHAWFATKQALLRHCNRAEHLIPDITEPLHTAMIHWNSEESS